MPNANLLRALVLVPFVAGCTVGPDFVAPKAPGAATGTQYTETPITGGVPLAVGADVPPAWWQLFRSPPLDQLVRTALASNPDMAAAQAALRQSQENFNAQFGSTVFPQAGLGLDATRQRAADCGGTGIGTCNLVSLSGKVSYTFDIFGGNRRALEALAAQVDYQQFQVEATYLALAANVATTAISEASLRAQLAATNDVLAIQRKQLNVIEAQFDAGAIAETGVLAQKTQTQQTLATIPPIQSALARTRHQLSVYMGRLPSQGGLPDVKFANLRLPRSLPVTLPASLIRQRPDIRSSEALLHQASAQIGVATANLYPQLTLNGNIGASGSNFDTLFDAGGLWSLAAGLTQPIFQGGALRARKRGAVAAYEQSLANYRSIVLGGFQDVADALRANEYDNAALQSQIKAEALARKTLDLSRKQFQAGAVSYVSVLDAQDTLLQTRIARIQAQAALYSDAVALFSALGGGWWNRPAAAPATATAQAAATGSVVN